MLTCFSTTELWFQSHSYNLLACNKNRTCWERTQVGSWGTVWLPSCHLSRERNAPAPYLASLSSCMFRLLRQSVLAILWFWGHALTNWRPSYSWEWRLDFPTWSLSKKNKHVLLKWWTKPTSECWHAKLLCCCLCLLVAEQQHCADLSWNHWFVDAFPRSTTSLTLLTTKPRCQWAITVQTTAAYWIFSLV